SLDICSLSKLINIFHTHKAILRYNKVYILLSISSNNTSTASLLSDYIIL
ncbi:hypothetical protein K469DRAFT_575388, partial [Zopfia rhizophila CBS 207.26]